jgi:peptidoglycan/xylan/chitin deacetylase (PgdA/CDA1 family)
MIRKITKYIFHHIFCNTLLLLSADRLISNLIGHKRLIVMYHGVRTTRQRINGRHITATQFERHLKYFTRHFDVIPLHEICEMKLRGIIPKRKTIALTFDDGFLNNLTVAVPLLEQYEVPATFFLCGAAIEDDMYFHPVDWIDLVRFSPGDMEVTIGEDMFLRHRHELRSRESNRPAYQYINALPLYQLNTVLEKMKKDFSSERLTSGVHKELYALVRGASIDDLIGHDLVRVGSHGYHHVNLSILPKEEIDHEMVNSKKALSNYSKQPVEAVAFPYGSYNVNVIESAERTGFKYLIAGGEVSAEFKNLVFPRIGVLDGAGFAYSMLTINLGFRRFGF